MNSISIGLAALSGLLAAAVAYLFIASPKKKPLSFTAAGLVIFAALYAAALRFVLPDLNAWVQARNVESSLLRIPAYQAIKRYDPQTYNRIVSDLKSALKSGADESRILVQIRGHVTRLIRKRLPTASDDAVISYMKVVLTEMNELERQSPELCFKFVFPEESGPIDGRKYFSPQTQEADLAALAEVIRTSGESPQPVPSEGEVMSKLQPIYRELRIQYGSDLRMLQSPPAPNVDKGRVCAMATSLYAKILDLPQAESGKILRFMLSRS